MLPFDLDAVALSEIFDATGMDPNKLAGWAAVFGVVFCASVALKLAGRGSLAGAKLACRMGRAAAAKVTATINPAVDPVCAEILSQLEDECAMLKEGTTLDTLEADKLRVKIGHKDAVFGVYAGSGEGNLFHDLTAKEKRLVQKKVSEAAARVRARDRAMRRSEALTKLTYEPTLGDAVRKKA